ncbi:MAG: dynamin family protein [Spirochaetes bacterium]|nr:dynamin family protein [Spirochaetota bacterium]
MPIALAAGAKIAAVFMAGAAVAKTLAPIAIKGAVAGAAMAKTAAPMVMAGGGVVHNYLKEKMPLDGRQEIGREDFRELQVSLPENLGYIVKDHKIKERIELLVKTAETLEAPEAYYSMIDGILRQLNDDTYTVLIAGRFSTGKSTLLNKLLGKEILKATPGETTKTLAWLWHGESDGEAAWYHDFNDDLHTIKLEEIADIPEEPPVLNVFAAVNADILKHGAMLIDTPGLQASGDTAKIAMNAAENADAIILVVDLYLEAKDKEFIKKLQKEGKGDRLFVVMNKIDQAGEEMEAVIAERKKMLSDMGILAHVFPLSCKKPALADSGLQKFQDALADFLQKDLQKAREAGISQRIKNTAASFSKLCEEAMQIGKMQNQQERARLKAEAEDRMNQAKREMNRIIGSQKNEIAKLEGSVLNKWSVLLGKIKDEVSDIIRNANEAQLNQPNQLLGSVQGQINAFLMNEFSEAEEQIRGKTFADLEAVQLPAAQGETQLAVNLPTRWGQNLYIPPELASTGLMAYTFITRFGTGLFGVGGMVMALPQFFLINMLSPFINKIFEQGLKVIGDIGFNVFRTRMQKEINDNWPDVDENVRSKIREYFAALKEQIERCGNETINDITKREKGKIKMTESDIADKMPDIENYKLRFDAMS